MALSLYTFNHNEQALLLLWTGMVGNNLEVVGVASAQVGGLLFLFQAKQPDS